MEAVMMLATIQSRLIAAGAVLLAILASLAAVFRAGKRAAESEQTRATLDTLKDYKDVQDNVARLPDRDVRSRLRAWSRN